MKRPIKFEYGFESVNSIVKKVYELHEIPNIKEKCDVWGVLPIKYVRQFTGLTDKNGREIYEGDIVIKEGNPRITKASYLNRKYVVEFNTDYAEFRFNPLISMVDGHVFIPRVSWEIEIIGNIHENPELLTA